MQPAFLPALLCVLLAIGSATAADGPKKPEAPQKSTPDKKTEAPKKEKPPAKPADPKKPDAAKKPEPPKAENPKKAVTAVDQVDADYWLQGEYYGALADGSQIGLHVMALGDGKFEAIEFLGGLPGYDWWPGMAKAGLKGSRDGAGAKLTGAKHNIHIVQGLATVTDPQQQSLGTLQRVERQSNTMGAAPPAGAVVLFDGTSTSQLNSANVTADHLLKPGATTKMPVGDFHMHLEFRTPYKPAGRGQDRGNSGVYIQGRYEMQILDSFGLEPQFNDCASIYRQRAPDFNMSYAPLVWQTYDIWFHSPHFNSAGEKVQNARVTLWQNGVAVHNNVEITAKTGAGKAEGPSELPILLQDHGNPVTFRNIWLVPGADTCAECDAVRHGLFHRRG